MKADNRLLTTPSYLHSKLTNLMDCITTGLKADVKTYGTMREHKEVDDKMKVKKTKTNNGRTLERKVKLKEAVNKVTAYWIPKYLNIGALKEEMTSERYE